jgi:hypothetical protein
MQPVVDSIHELFVGVEALGTQPDLNLGEEMVIAWCQVRTVRRVVKNLPVESLIKAFVRAAVWGCALLCRRMPLVCIPDIRLIQPLKLIQRFTINLRHYCGPWCHELCQQNSLTVLLHEENESQHVPHSWRERR